MKQEIFNLYKMPGETPLERLNRFRIERLDLRDAPLTYAGRLDPMAEGVLVVLSGKARFDRDSYLSLDKDYEFDVLWGFESDTYDILGIARAVALPPEDIGERAAEIVPLFIGEFNQEYPPFSSKPVSGKPLFAHSREGNVVGVPKKRVEIRSLAVSGTQWVGAPELAAGIREKIGLVKGDFRQGDALQSWEQAFRELQSGRFLVTTFRATVTSGTYVRSLAHRMGKHAGCGAIALRIVRTKVGEWKIADSA